MRNYRITENQAGRFREASRQTVGFSVGNNKEEAIENFKKAFYGKEDRNDVIVYGGIVNDIRNVRAELEANY